jgi:uncharacterized membrane protein
VTRGWRIVLAVSLALNLAVAGLVAGAALRNAGLIPGFAPPAARDPGLGPFAPALSPEDRMALRRAFAAERAGVISGLRADRADRAALLAALRAEPYDPAAVAALTARMAERQRDRAGIGQRLVEERLAAMTPEARRAFADRLEAAHARSWREQREGEGRGEGRPPRD